MERAIGGVFALMWVGEILRSPAKFIGTESRLNTIFDLLRQMVYGAEEDPDRRLAELRRPRLEPPDPSPLEPARKHCFRQSRHSLAVFVVLNSLFRASSCIQLEDMPPRRRREQ